MPSPGYSILTKLLPKIQIIFIRAPLPQRAPAPNDRKVTGPATAFFPPPGATARGEKARRCRGEVDPGGSPNRPAGPHPPPFRTVVRGGGNHGVTGVDKPLL